MAPPLPPLNALRAFDAAGRHLSFTKAADELNVTPAAISHQIKALEEYVGAPLFKRLTRALNLTSEGQAALPLVREGFEKLTEGVAQMSVAGDQSLTISVSTSFGGKWLVPRLERFRRAHPELEIRIDADERLVDFARDQVDVAVRFGNGEYLGLRADRLHTEEAFPVCSPALLEGPDAIREPADLARHTLLHVDWRTQDDTQPDWRMWLLAAGAPEVDGDSGLKMSHDVMALQVAIEGQGVALANSALAADDLASGRLVKPFDPTLDLKLGFAYYVVSPEATADRPQVAAFRNWVLAEARRDEAGSQDQRL